MPRAVSGGRATGTSTSSLSEHPRCIDSQRAPAWTWPRYGRRTGARSLTYVSTRHRRRFASCPRSEDPIVRSVTSRSSLPAVWSPDGRYLVAGRAGDPSGPAEGPLPDSGARRRATRPYPATGVGSRICRRRSHRTAVASRISPVPVRVPTRTVTCNSRTWTRPSRWRVHPGSSQGRHIPAAGAV